MTAPRRGFTLLELLVVIAIVGVLLGLLLPAVQKARDAAARVQCLNNLKQIGLALHNYHDSNLSLPSGVSSGAPYPRMSWLTRLLPYVEQAPLWQATEAAYDYQWVPYLNPPHVGFGMPVAVYSCLSDPRTSRPQNTHQNLCAALTSYLGVLGTSFVSSDGVLFLDSRVRLMDISDGTSSTLAVGERPPSPDSWYGWWYAGYGQAGTGSADMLLGVREYNAGGPYVASCPSGPYHYQPGRFNQQCDLFHYWSLHTGGANFLFADASARLLSYDADAILPALATRAGGEVVEVP